jgi:hypothetical protein
MALERKDIRAKLDPDDHAALTRIAEADGLDIAALVERELLRYIRHELHRASVISGSPDHPGKSGNRRALSGNP